MIDKRNLQPRAANDQLETKLSTKMNVVAKSLIIGKSSNFVYPKTSPFLSI